MSETKENKKNNFWVRTLSGAAVLALVIVTTLLGGKFTDFFWFIVSGLGLYEFFKLRDRAFSPFAILAYIFLFPIWFFFLSWNLQIVFALILTYLMLASGILLVTHKKYATADLAYGIFGLLAVGISLIFIIRIRRFESPNRALYAFLPIIAAWGSDTIAYLTGSLIGKHKMTPEISPKKSWEGLIGGLAGSILLGALYGFIFRNQLSVFVYPALECAILCAIGGAAGVFGDLIMSLLKRETGKKDFSRLIPGHGGVLDRFDSLLFTAPVVYYAMDLMIHFIWKI